MNVGSLFSGIGLLDYGLTLAGWHHAFLCESEPDRRAILSMRWPGVPIYSDVRDVDGSAPRVDLLAGGFPCRGASTAGLREGLDHPETALWREFARIIGELRPRLVLLENVANLLAVRDGQAWAEVVGDLASLGYVFAWDCLPAAAFGAPHLRDRVFLVAHAETRSEGCDAAKSARRLATEPRRGVAPDPPSTNGQGTRPGRQALGRAQPNDPLAPADSQRNGVRQQPESERGSGGARESAKAGEDAPDARSGGWANSQAEPSRSPTQRQRTPSDQRSGSVAGNQLARRDSPIDWGDYTPAIARWEETHGPAPEPLIRGVDARGARKVVRSRLSALGDGVQVQAGHYLGERLLTALPRDRKEAA